MNTDEQSGPDAAEEFDRGGAALVESIARDLEGLLASDARPIDYELLQKARIAAKNYSMDGAEVSVVNDGLSFSRSRSLKDLTNSQQE